MPQMNKSGKFIFGESLIRPDGSVRLPPQAVEEYHIASEGRVYLFTGSKVTGGFCVTRQGLLLPSKLGHILTGTPALLHYSPGARAFKPGTRGAEFVPELNVVSDHIFTKTAGNALTSEEFAAFIRENGINKFFVAGADATVCIKSTCYNMRKAGYTVHVLSDCITSYDKKKIPEMLAYYEGKGCTVSPLEALL